MKTSIFMLGIFISSLSFSQTVFSKFDILGKWQTYDEKTGKANGIIEFINKNGEVVAKVHDGPEVYNSDGSLKKDLKNPDKTKRDKFVKGMIFIYDLQWVAEEHKFKKGKVYDSRSGNTYSANLEMISKDKLKVVGYLGITLFGKTVYWTRVK